MSDGLDSTDLRPENWKTIRHEDSVHWDRWFLVVLETEFGGDWDALKAAIKERCARSYGDHDDVERKMSHLNELRARLDRLKLAPEDCAHYALRAGSADRETVERVHGFHADRCPVARSLPRRDRGDDELHDRLGRLRGATHRGPPQRRFLSTPRRPGRAR